MSADASASAIAAFSTTGHPVYTNWPQSKIVRPSGLVAGGRGGMSCGSISWTVKIRLEFGKNTPRINWLSVPVGKCVAAAVPPAAAAGHPIVLLVASAAGKSLLPAGNPLLFSTCATRSAPCSIVSCGGGGGG